MEIGSYFKQLIALFRYVGFVLFAVVVKDSRIIQISAVIKNR